MRNNLLILILGLAGALVCFLLGWQVAQISKADHLSIGQSIASSWESQMQVLINSRGEPRSPNDIQTSAQYSLATLTMALAMHHNEIPDEQWNRIEPRLNETIGVTPPEILDRMTQLIECINKARRVGTVDGACVVRAQSIPPRETSSPTTR